MTTTSETITDEQIEALHHEASKAGDKAQMIICERALDGDYDATAECVRVIREAEAMAD